MSQEQKPVPSQAENQTRIIDTLTGPVEKRVLLWLAAHMPARVTPDTLTMIGLLAALVIFLGYALTYYHIGFIWLASFGFVLQWFGDSLDGTLARYRKIERPRYGFFVDHLIDSVSVAMIFIGLGISPFVRFDLAMLALTSYLLLSIYVYLITYVNGIFRISYAHLGPTEMRMVAILANSVVFFTGNPTLVLPAGGVIPVELALTYYDVVAVLVILLAVVIFTVNSIQSAASLSLEDRIAHRAKRLEERAVRLARRQALRDERAMRRETARAAKAQLTRRKLPVPTTGQDKT